MQPMGHPGNECGATGVVLAGGRSSRMGQPKALLLFDNEPLIKHIVGKLLRLFREVVVVAAPEQELPSLPATLVRDEVAYQGPVAGIYYGVKAAGSELAFVTSCDSAFLNPGLIQHLVSRATDHDVVVPHWEGRFQPLHAVYRRGVLPFLETQLSRGELRPVFLFDKVRTRRIDDGEIRRFDPEGLSFFNMNTPGDYREALRLWGNAARGPNPKAGECMVELFGVARLVAKTPEVQVALPEHATVSDVLAALAEKLPVLVGRVIDNDRARLVNGYTCNVNGVDFVRNPHAAINSGDRIIIMSADAGG
jgi:molybdopterin-guanine dinucleotide biosynthesis protein A